MHGILKPKCGQQHTRQSVFSLSGLSWTRKCQRAGELVSWFGGGVSSNCFFTYLSAGLLPQCSGFCLFHTQTRTHKVFWEKVQLPWWEWLMTPFTAQTPHNQRCWGSVSACCLVWVITAGTQLIHCPTINPAVYTCCPPQCRLVLVQIGRDCFRLFLTPYKNKETGVWLNVWK